MVVQHAKNPRVSVKALPASYTSLIFETRLAIRSALYIAWVEPRWFRTD